MIRSGRAPVWTWIVALSLVVAVVVLSRSRRPPEGPVRQPPSTASPSAPPRPRPTAPFIVHRLVGHGRSPVRSRFSPDGSVLATADTTGCIAVWNARSGRLARRIQTLGRPFAALAFSGDGSVLAALDGGVSRAVMTWATADGRRAGRPAIPGPAVAIETMADGPGFWIAPARASILRLDPWSGAVWDEIGTEAPCRPIGPSRSGAVCVGLGGPRVRVYKAGGRGFFDLVDGGPGPVEALALSPDCERLFACFSGGVVAAWADGARRQVWRRTFPKGTDSIALSGDGSLLAVAGPDGKVTVLNAASGTTAAELGSHRGRTTSVTFSPAGPVLASTGTDRTVVVHDVEALLGTK